MLPSACRLRRRRLPVHLGTFREDQLPADATMSIEIDILPIADDNAGTERLADLIEGVAGEFSPFEELHGFSIDGVDLTTSALPTGWCLDKDDLCVAKLCAFREKDRNFVAALVRSALVDRATILSRSQEREPTCSDGR